MKLSLDCFEMSVFAFLPAVAGLLFATEFLLPYHGRVDTPRPDPIAACTRFDAVHYAGIVESGYSYDPGRRSNVAFFPGYPVAASALREATGWPTVVCLLVVSYLALFGAFIAFAAYLRTRWPDMPATDQNLTLALFGLCPAGLFFRMPYSESPFLFVSILALLGFARRWPLIVVALLAGTATAIRPVGVAVAAAVLWSILADRSRGDRSARVLAVLAWLPVCCWGLFAYMAYQAVRFDNPFAFAQTQEFWTHAQPPERDLGSKAFALATFKPIWSVYVPGAPQNWAVTDSHGNPFFSLLFWNPIVFVAAAILIGVGVRRKWLNGPEAVLGFGLLAIPYVTRAYEMAMASHARFAAVAFPAYIVLARLLANRPPWWTWSTLAIFAVLLTFWTALFAAGYVFF